MEVARDAGVRDFKARPPQDAFADSRIRIAVVLTVCLMTPALVVWAIGRFLPSFVPWMVFGILLFINVIFLVVGFVLSTVGDRVAAGIHYEVTNTELRLFGGNVHYTIPLDSIKRVYKRDLDLSIGNRPMVRSTYIRMPNLSLGDVQYKDTGPLKMCATSLWKDITLIETTGMTYGVTPANEEEFRAALGVRG